MAAANYPIPPTYALPIIKDQTSGESVFNPIWLRWFLDLGRILGLAGAGGTGGSIQHNSLAGLQGGSAGQDYHLTLAQWTAITTSGGAPGGVLNSIQYNNPLGAFAGNSGFTYDPVAGGVTAGAFIPTSSTTPTNGMFLVGANALSWATGSVRVMDLDSLGNLSIRNGYLNMNTASVDAAMLYSIAGVIKAYVGIPIGNGGLTAGSIAGDFIVRSQGGNCRWSVTSGASTAMVLDTSGNLTLTTGNFIGPLTGNVTGNVSGSSGSTTGNAATATALQTARAINGVNFDGTAPITVTAAAGTLTGTTLNATVVTSSLTSVGTLARSLASRRPTQLPLG